MSKLTDTNRMDYNNDIIRRTLILTPLRWELLLIELRKHHSFSVCHVTDKQKEVLGFVRRYHVSKDDKGHWIETIRLDFYDDAKQTFFMLKYSEFLDTSKK